MGTMAFLPVVGEAAGQSNQNQNQRSIASPAQNQNPSLADLARRERALHKNQPQTDMVWSNDNLPEAGGISVVGPPAEKAANAASPSENEGAGNENPEGAAAARPGPADQLGQTKQRLEDAKQRLASLRIDLNLAQREFTLDQNQYDSNPNKPVNRSGEDKLREDSRQVDEKQQAVIAAENEVARLEQALPHEAPASGANPSPSQ